MCFGGNKHSDPECDHLSNIFTVGFFGSLPSTKTSKLCLVFQFQLQSDKPNHTPFCSFTKALFQDTTSLHLSHLELPLLKCTRWTQVSKVSKAPSDFDIHLPFLRQPLVVAEWVSTGHGEGSFRVCWFCFKKKRATFALTSIDNKVEQHQISAVFHRIHLDTSSFSEMKPVR